MKIWVSLGNSSQIREKATNAGQNSSRRGREKENARTRRVERIREREREISLKIGSNKLSTIFAGLNTLKRLEIRPPGGPFVRRVAGDRHEGLRRVIRAAEREAPGIRRSEMKRATRRENPRYYSCHRCTLSREL